jgi:hypothetical protein
LKRNIRRATRDDDATWQIARESLWKQEIIDCNNKLSLPRGFFMLRKKLKVGRRYPSRG